MIDIHCHILPGLDDGPDQIETSTAMAAIAAQDGIRVIIATPHTDGIRVNRNTVGAGVRELNHALTQLAIPVEILAGYEIPLHLAPELAPTHTLAGSRYILLEYPHTYIPNDAVAAIYELIDQGLQPIIAHPERNGGILARPELLSNLVEAGALSQVTATSLTGELGPDIHRCALYLLKNNLVHFIATDSHSPAFRKPVLRKAHSVTAKLFGGERADLLTTGNPDKILQARA